MGQTSNQKISNIGPMEETEAGFNHAALVDLMMQGTGSVYTQQSFASRKMQWFAEIRKIQICLGRFVSDSKHQNKFAASHITFHDGDDTELYHMKGRFPLVDDGEGARLVLRYEDLPMLMPFNVQLD